MVDAILRLLPDVPVAVWLPIATLILGAVLQEWLRSRSDSRVAKREREAREESRRDQRRERHNVFQRETLLALQGAVTNLGRTGALMNLADMRAFRETGEWRKNLYGQELSERVLAARLTMETLGARVADEQVRSLCDEIRRWHKVIPNAATPEEGDAAMANVSRIGPILNERIGVILRELDAEDLAVPISGAVSDRDVDSR